ncbi:hypothetical protein HMPREF9120_02397 [Neisseria sp. oral taxon 020 str. F0370]|nr:hypothetical protein HMPREF9120_02397 [Neisseria sp. oral taxon 020 str. F0370]
MLRLVVLLILSAACCLVSFRVVSLCIFTAAAACTAKITDNVRRKNIRRAVSDGLFPARIFRFTRCKGTSCPP